MFIIPLSQVSSLFPTGEAQGAAGATQTQATVPFADMLKDAMRTMQETRAVANEDSVNLALGQTDDLHTMQINSVKAATAVEFTTGLASRALSAYNEIIRMQI